MDLIDRLNGEEKVMSIFFHREYITTSMDQNEIYVLKVDQIFFCISRASRGDLIIQIVTINFNIV